MHCLAFAVIPEGLTHPAAFLILGSLAAALVSMGKAGFGGSIGILSVPILIYACQGKAFLATGIMLPVLIGCDVMAVAMWWRQWNWHAVWLLLPGAVVGVVLGWATLTWMQHASPTGTWDGQRTAEAYLTLAIGVIALGFVLLQAFRALRSRPLEFRPVLWQGSVFGVLAGYTSTLAHSAGPVATMYMLPQRMPKGRYVASTVLYYAIGNELKVIPYWQLGMLQTQVWAGALALLPAVVAGTLLGLFLHKRVGQRSFNLVVYALLALAGIDMIRSSLTVLIS
jgi:hypothetical protein